MGPRRSGARSNSDVLRLYLVGLGRAYVVRPRPLRGVITIPRERWQPLPDRPISLPMFMDYLESVTELGVEGKVQRDKSGYVIHVIADTVQDWTPMLSLLSGAGAGISSLARADEVKRPDPSSARDSRNHRSRRAQIRAGS